MQCLFAVRTMTNSSLKVKATFFYLKVLKWNPIVKNHLRKRKFGASIRCF